jgi:hypothetical protein
MLVLWVDMPGIAFGNTALEQDLPCWWHGNPSNTTRILMDRCGGSDAQRIHGFRLVAMSNLLNESAAWT